MISTGCAYRRHTHGQSQPSASSGPQAGSAGLGPNRSHRQPFPPLGAAPLEDVASGLRPHARTEAVGLLAPTDVRLEGSLHEQQAPSDCEVGEERTLILTVRTADRQACVRPAQGIVSLDGVVVAWRLFNTGAASCTARPARPFGRRFLFPGLPTTSQRGGTPTQDLAGPRRRPPQVGAPTGKG